jgi:hypothetical protein
VRRVVASSTRHFISAETSMCNWRASCGSCAARPSLPATPRSVGAECCGSRGDAETQCALTCGGSFHDGLSAVTQSAPFESTIGDAGTTPRSV